MYKTTNKRFISKNLNLLSILIGKLTLVIWCRDNLFQLFFCKKEIPKIAEHMYSQNRSKMTFLKRGVDGFSYFSLTFSYFIFYSESSLLVEPTIICSFCPKIDQRTILICIIVLSDFTGL
jgi:hypothetical protein